VYVIKEYRGEERGEAEVIGLLVDAREGGCKLRVRSAAHGCKSNLAMIGLACYAMLCYAMLDNWTEKNMLLATNMEGVQAHLAAAGCQLSTFCRACCKEA